MAALPSITPPPVSPSPSDGPNFATRAYAFLAWIYSAFGTEIATWIAAFNSATNTVNSSITTAVSSASSASASATTASTALAQSLAAINASTVYPPSVVTSFYDPTVGLPTSPVTGRAYVASATANGWTVNRIYKYSGTGWTEYAPVIGWLVLDASKPAYIRWDGASWARQITAFDVSVGLGADQVPTWAMLGTAAGLDQTWLYASATWDAGSVATAAQTSTTVAVPGAEIGDNVMPSASSALSGLNLRGEVTATDVVTLYLSNVTGSPVDLASATYYIAVLKRTPAR